MRIGLIANTHMPGALESLWPQVIEAFASVDYILHAGDLHVPQVIDDLASLVSKLRDEGVRFKNDIVEGPGGKQILCEDPSGSVVELLQPA